jgi:hypothetical protein
MVEQMLNRHKMELFVTNKEWTVNEIKRFNNRVASMKLKNIFKFSVNLIGLQSKCNSVLYNRPSIVGVNILNNSKVHLYSLYYDIVKAALNARLCYVDTDSFFISYNGDRQLIQSMYEKYGAHYFDTSKSIDFNNKIMNRGRAGMLAEEHDGKFIREFIALRAKCYSLKFDDNEVCCKAKGIPHSATKKFNFEQYYHALKSSDKLRVKITKISSLHHQVYSTVLNKISLSRGNDKRNFKTNETVSVPWGFYAKNGESEEEDLPFILNK